MEHGELPYKLNRAWDGMVELRTETTKEAHVKTDVCHVCRTAYTDDCQHAVDGTYSNTVELHAETTGRKHRCAHVTIYVELRAQTTAY